MSHTRPKLLFLCQNLPHPPDAGAEIRSFHTLRLLSQTFDVTSVHFYTSANKTTAGAVAAAVTRLSAFGQATAFRVPQDASRIRYGWDHFRSVITGRAYTRWMYDVGAVRAWLKKLDPSRFDILHVDSLDLVAYLRSDLPIPIVLAHHNVESRLLARRASMTRGWQQAYIRHQASLTRDEEARWCPQVALNVVVSAEDQKELQGIAPGAECRIVPNGVDTVALAPSGRPSAAGGGLVFVGGYSWFPNRDGMEFFTRDILPLLRNGDVQPEVTWVGRAPEEVRREFARHGVRMTGYVEDMREHVRAAACVIVPLRVGGGTRLKILDAWALGKAVVSTPQGCEGLHIEAGGNIVVADGPDAFALAIQRVLADGALRSRLENGARQTAVELYDWEVVGQEMRNHYLTLIEDATAGRYE
jgi:polysaccharide biosynthesis protein PslH